MTKTNNSLNQIEKKDIISLFYMATGVIVDTSQFTKIKIMRGGEVIDTIQCEHDIKNRDR